MSVDTAVRTVLVCLAPGPAATTLQSLIAPLRPTVRVTTDARVAAACQMASPAKVLLIHRAVATNVMAQIDRRYEPATTVIVRSRDPTVWPTLVAALSGLPLATDDTLNAAVLTPREMQILKLMCNGRSNAQIARELRIGTSTVSTAS